MKLPTLPALPLDTRDRQALASVVTLAGLCLILLLGGALALGVSVRLFLIASGLGG